MDYQIDLKYQWAHKWLIYYKEWEIDNLMNMVSLRTFYCLSSRFSKKRWGYYEHFHPSVCRWCYLLLNHWAEYNQTCYITSTHGKGVQYYFSVRLSVRPLQRPSSYLLLNHWGEFNQISRHGKAVWEQHYFSAHASVHPASVHLSIELSPPKPLGGIQPN